MASSSPRHYNYIRYQTSTYPAPLVGHLDFTTSTIQPLCFTSGTPLPSLYAAILAGASNITTTTSQHPTPLSNVTILPPLPGRDVLAIGKNYAAHASEFHASGYDSSDKTAMPSHPVIFSKRATSILPHGAAIHPHPTFADTLDYEGEIGLIVGKVGYRVSRADAPAHIWGYTIINDVTSRNEQRDHKQFFLGKSADGYCPMGPVAVPREALPDVLTVRTKVNGEVRQEATTQDLIFGMAELVETVSRAQTIRPGDVIATGTPAGVGFGFQPPKWLRPGDEVRIEVTGLGELVNRVGDPREVNLTVERVRAETQKEDLPVFNAGRVAALTTLPGGKQLYYRRTGKPGGQPLVFVHGLGGSSEYFSPLLPLLEPHCECHVFDLEGHGLSPTTALSTLSIGSFARDLEAVVQHAGLKTVTLLAHSMGCLVALKYATANPHAVAQLVLMGPPPSPLPDAAAANNVARAQLVRDKGMVGCVDAVIGAGLSEKSRASRPLAVAATRLSLLGTDAEGYAKACTALAGSKDETLDATKLHGTKVLVLTGSEDKVCPAAVAEKYKAAVGESLRVETLADVGHWHLFEDVEGVQGAVAGALGVK